MDHAGARLGSCDLREVESLASTVLAASSLQDPADDRVRKLTAVLAYLERRIAGMLEPSAQAGAPSLLELDDHAAASREECR